MNIGQHTFDHPLILAPMAGVTDRPFRILCRQLGADLCVSEMITSQKHLWNSKKTRLRMNHDGETAPRSVQIAGTEPQQLAEAARFNIDHGADIIDINMGCPAKKVCNVLAGSALMKDERKVGRILSAVVNSIEQPVTLKMRTGWDQSNKNALQIAHIAEQEGIAAITIHGRTRQCAYRGEAEYDTIAEVKSRLSIPVIANGDINTPEKAAAVLRHTQADALMIGRAAQGNPWIFSQIKHFLEHGQTLKTPTQTEIAAVMEQHLKNLYNFYGETAGVRIARKHIAWYCKHQNNKDNFSKIINTIESAPLQQKMVIDFLLNNNNQAA